MKIGVIKIENIADISYLILNSQAILISIKTTHMLSTHFIKMPEERYRNGTMKKIS